MNQYKIFLLSWPLLTIFSLLFPLGLHAFKPDSEVSDEEREELRIAVEQDDLAKIYRLVELRDVDPNTPDETSIRRFPLHHAVSPAMVDALVKLGTDVNARDANGMTALHTACWHGYYDVANRLLALGADATLLDNQGHNAEQLSTNDEPETAVENIVPVGLHRAGVQLAYEPMTCEGDEFGQRAQAMPPPEPTTNEQFQECYQRLTGDDGYSIARLNSQAAASRPTLPDDEIAASMMRSFFGM